MVCHRTVNLGDNLAAAIICLDDISASDHATALVVLHLSDDLGHAVADMTMSRWQCIVLEFRCRCPEDAATTLTQTKADS
jgi:hypothetical protein